MTLFDERDRDPAIGEIQGGRTSDHSATDDHNICAGAQPLVTWDALNYWRHVATGLRSDGGSASFQDTAHATGCSEH
jgi:hypothetical protein